MFWVAVASTLSALPLSGNWAKGDWPYCLEQVTTRAHIDGGLSSSNQYPSTEGKSKYVSPLWLHNGWDWKDVAQLFVLQCSHRWKWKSKSRLESSTQTTCKLNEVWYDSAAPVCVLHCRASCHALMIKPSFLAVSLDIALFLNSQPKPPSLFPLITTDYVFAINLPQQNTTASFLYWHLDKASAGPARKSLLHLPVTALSVTTPWDCYYACVWE